MRQDFMIFVETDNYKYLKYTFGLATKDLEKIVDIINTTN